MKKLIAILLLAVMAILFVGCGEGYGCEGCGNNNIGIGTITSIYLMTMAKINALKFYLGKMSKLALK